MNHFTPVTSENISYPFCDVILSSYQPRHNHLTFLRAVEIATKAHANTFREGGEPVIGHPIRVMRRCMVSVDAMIIAILHDVVEDSEITLLELQKELGLHESIIKEIDLLTRRTGESREDYIDRVVTSNRAMAIKLYDIEDNLLSLTPKIQHREERYLINRKRLTNLLSIAAYDIRMKSLRENAKLH